MISIIICSVNQQLLDKLTVNIEQTIGVAYQIIAINNQHTNDGICKVYNKGGENAVFPILCFIHEDILFETSNWGFIIIEHFKDTKIGLLGIAGGDTKGLVPSSWSTSFISNEINVIQHSAIDNDIAEHIVITEKNSYQTHKKAATLDGVFLCTRKEIFNQCKFDESNLKGFHGYDIDYSLQVFSKYDVIVIFDILLHHFSVGKPDKTWVDSAFIISKKWRKQLPVSVYPLSAAEFNFYHWKSLQIFLEKLFHLNYSYSQIIFYYLSYSFTKYFTVRRFFSMGKYVFNTMYEKSRRSNQATMESVRLIKQDYTH